MAHGRTEKTYPIVPASSAPTRMVDCASRSVGGEIVYFWQLSRENRVVSARHSVSCSVRACALVRVGRVSARPHAPCVMRRWSLLATRAPTRGPMDAAKTLSRNGSNELQNGIAKLRETPALRYRLLLVFGLFLVWL